MRDREKVVLSSARLWERRKRRYRYGDFNSDSTDLGQGANRMYRAVMRADDLREARKRIDEVLGRLDRKSRRFAEAIVKKRRSLPQVRHEFKLEIWESEDRLEAIIAMIEAMNLEPALCPVRHPYGGFSPGCTMRKNHLRSDS